jgi:cellobiose phosphorylase
MVCGIIGGLFTPEQAQDHLALIRTHLLFPDGVRLMDRPIEYRGGPETIFRRAESSSFFGREIGLAYTHAHLRYCEALAALGEIEALRASLRLANPISVTTDVPNASLRQRNTYFSSSDAAFADRYQASDQWERVRNGAVAVEGGWRVYSSGPGIFTRLAAAARGF